MEACSPWAACASAAGASTPCRRSQLRICRISSSCDTSMRSAIRRIWGRVVRSGTIALITRACW
jgi:hypothetical protein